MKNKLIYLLVIGFMVSACADLNELSPNNSVPTATAVTNRASALAALNGVYDELQNATLTFDGYLAFPQFFSDEADATGTFPSRLEMGNLNVTTSNTTLATIYSEFYDVINVANNVISLIPQVEDESFTDEERNNVVGQAKMVRAHMYQYLTSYWKSVPLITTPTVEVGEVLNVPLASEEQIYAQIENDLNDAINGIIAETGPNQASKQAAQALMARAKLYQGKFGEALTFATNALGSIDISSVPYMQDNIYNLGFTGTDGNSLGFFYGTSDLGGRYSIGPSQTIISAYEPGDLRFAASIDNSSFAVPYVLKYPSFAQANSGTATDPVMFVRHAEMAMIIAECAARANDFTTANEQFNRIRSRAGLAPATLTSSNFIDMILKERFVEFAFEGNHRLIDLRRTGKAVEVLGSIGYEACDDVWPIPQRDVDRNIAIIQNDCCNC